MSKSEKKRSGKVVLFILLGLVVLLALLNGTRLFYFEKSSYPTNDLSQIMDKRALPVEIKQGSRKAVICVHGMPSTPSEFQYLVQRFKEAGYDVYAPLLPGFGTRPENLINTSWRGWYAYLKDYYTGLRPLYDQVYVVGMSMGGALTLRLAEDFSSSSNLSPTAIATVSAPVFLNSLLENGVVLNPGLWISRTLGWFLPAFSPSPDDTSSLPDGGDRWLGYHGLFVRQIHSFKMGLKEVKRDLKKISTPIIMIQAKKDKDVPFQNLDYIYRHVSSPIKDKKEMDLGNIAHTHHVLIMYDSTREEVFKDIDGFFNRK